MSQPTTPRRQAAGSPLRALLVFVAMAGAGAMVGFFGARGADALGLLPELDLSRGQLFALLALLLPAWLLVVLLHELGHLAGGRLAGLRPLLLIVGPLKLTWVGGRTRLALNRSINLAGGVASAVPDDDRDLVRRQLLMVAGGPVASLVCGLLLLLATTAATGLGAAALAMAGALSLVIALATLIPSRAGGFTSDGGRLLMLLRGGPQAERMGASAVMVGAAMAGRLPELDPSIVGRATALRDGSGDDVGASLLAYTWALARGDFDEAGRQLDYALVHQEAIGPAGGPALRVEAAYFLGRHRGEAAAAREALAAAGRADIVEAHDWRRAEAAVLLAEGRAAEARAAAEAGLAALARARMGQAGELDAALLRDLLERCTMAEAAS